MPPAKRALPPITETLDALVEDAPPRPDDPVNAECRRLLATLRKQCPDLFVPGTKLKPGEVGPQIPVDREQGATLYRLVARSVAGLPTDRTDDPGVIVWTQGDDELAVLVDHVQVVTADGAVLVVIPVRCDETGDATVQVRFAVGSEKRPAGMVASTDERPFGPAPIIDVWGDALCSFAWQIVLRASANIADATGRDADGAGLIPVGLQASQAGIAVLTMARHTFDRRANPS